MTHPLMVQLTTTFSSSAREAEPSNNELHLRAPLSAARNRMEASPLAHSRTGTAADLECSTGR